jgi:hypothetical protein
MQLLNAFSICRRWHGALAMALVIVKPARESVRDR